MFMITPNQAEKALETEACPYHLWGDSWPEWPHLYEAEKYIYKYVYKYSRCRVIMKEKYGTLRYEYVFPPGGSLFFYSPLHRWWLSSWPYRKWESYGMWLLGKAINKASKKWPGVEQELRDDYECFIE